MIDIDIIYYNFLSIGNMDSNPISRGNLTSFMLKFTMEELRNPLSNANFSQLVGCSLIMLSHLFRPDTPNVDKLMAYSFILSNNLKFMVFQDLTQIFKLTTCFIVLIHDLGIIFDSTGSQFYLLGR
jgi:hypothetical protein